MLLRTSLVLVDVKKAIGLVFTLEHDSDLLLEIYQKILQVGVGIRVHGQSLMVLLFLVHK